MGVSDSFQVTQLSSEMFHRVEISFTKVKNQNKSVYALKAKYNV